MKSNYEDIYDLANLAGIKQTPSWYDENGVPRFVHFKPDLCPDIYAQEVILLEISCQNCGEKFMVQMSSWSWHKGRDSFGERMTKFLKDREKCAWSPLHYGDPPIHGCIGDTENCYDLRVVQFWEKDYGVGIGDRWVEHPEFEVALMDIPEDLEE